MRGESYKTQSLANQTLNDEIDKKNQLTKMIKKNNNLKNEVENKNKK
jgi:ferritin-like protein